MAISITLSAPDAALDDLKEAWATPGSTAAETRAAISAYLLARLREETERRVADKAQSAGNEAVITQVDARRATFNANWPVNGG